MEDIEISYIEFKTLMSTLESKHRYHPFKYTSILRQVHEKVQVKINPELYNQLKEI